MAGNNNLKDDWGKVWERADMFEINENEPALIKVSAILSKYKKGSRVLDAGSGLGQWIFYCQKKCFDSYGIEIVPKAVERCKEYSKRVKLEAKFLAGDVRNMPFAGNFFDVILSFGTIEHFPETYQAIREYYRTIKPGGTCFITTPNIYSARTFITRPILKVLKSPKLGYQGYEKSFSPKELAEMMSKAGFKEIKYGILPDGAFLGEFYKFIPLVGIYIFSITKKISFWIESHQSRLGHTAYCTGVK